MMRMTPECVSLTYRLPSDAPVMVLGMSRASATSSRRSGGGGATVGFGVWLAADDWLGFAVGDDRGDGLCCEQAATIRKYENGGQTVHAAEDTGTIR